MAKPVGTDLTSQQLVDALMYKVRSKSKKYSVSQIENLEKRLQTLTALLRGLRNLQSPMNRLPPEVLCIIFKECQQQLSSFLPCPEEDVSPGGGMHTMSPHDYHVRPVFQCVPPQAQWLLLSSVCRHWRGIIASFPVLWSAVDHALQPEMFLRRSRDIPIKVYMGLTPSGPPFSLAHVDMIVPHIHHVKELHLCQADWALSSQDVFQRLNQPAKELESLTIDGIGPNPPAALPPIFDGCMPRLRKLAISWYTSWPRTYFHHLTHLCIQGQNRDARPTTDEFLTFLEASPELEVLALVAAGPTRSPAEDLPNPLPERLIHLEHLRELSWGSVSDVMNVRRLLEHLVLPDFVHMYFWGSPIMQAHASEDLSGLLPVDQHNLPSLLQIKEWRCARTPAVLPFPHNIIAFVGSIMYINGPFYASQMEKVADTFPVSQVHTFFVEDVFSVGNVTLSPFHHPMQGTMSWKPIFAKMTKLRYLAIGATANVGVGGKSPTRTILGALYPSEKEEMLCKQLRTISVHDDAELPAFYVSALAEERERRGSPVTKFEVRAYKTSSLRRRSSSSSSVTSASSASTDSMGAPRGQRNMVGLEEEDLKALKKSIRNVDMMCLKLPKGHVKPIDMFPPGFSTHPVYLWTTILPRPMMP